MNNQQLLVSMFFGGLAGALVTAFFNWQRSKTDVALRLTDQLLSRFDEIKEAKELLNSKSIDWTNDANIDRYNKVLKVANWYEVFAACCMNGHANLQILKDLGITENARKFYIELRDAKCSGAESNRMFSDDELFERWGNLRRLSYTHGGGDG